MSRNDDRGSEKLPVTGEVGSEGGSFADATMQVAQVEDDLGRTAQAAEPDEVESDGTDVKKYPTETPD